MNPITILQNALKDNIADQELIRKAIFEVLEAYAKNEIKELPRDVALQIANYLKGLDKKATKNKTSRKSANKTLTEIECIKDGVKYIQWVKAGLIKDKSYNRTVRQAFNVNSSTVRSWVLNKKYQSKLPNPKSVTDKECESVKKIINFSGNYYRNSNN